MNQFSSDSKKRIEELIQIGINEGGKAILDGRNTKIKGFENGNFINPTIIEDVNLKKEIINTEIFGPVMSLVSMKTLDNAIDFINNSNYGNMACIIPYKQRLSVAMRIERRFVNIFLFIDECK